MKKIIVFILLGLLFVACKKKSTVHITAKNAITGKPYPGLKYTIIRSKTGLYESHYKTVASGTLDENGEAVITKQFSKNWSNEVSLAHPDNTCYSKKDNFYFSGGENINCDFEFAECGYLKQWIHNVNCQGNSDTLILKRDYLEGDKNVFIPVTLTGCVNDKGVAVVPMGNYLVKWTVIRNGNSQSFTTQVYVPKLDTANLVVNY